MARYTDQDFNKWIAERELLYWLKYLKRRKREKIIVTFLLIIILIVPAIIAVIYLKF